MPRKPAPQETLQGFNSPKAAVESQQNKMLKIDPGPAFIGVAQ
jgi:hypothetical protein